MSRFRLILVAVPILGASILYGLWPQFVPPITTVPEKEVLITRGPAIQETPEQRSLRESVARLSHETPLPLSWIQAGVTFNGEIPLWGLISAIILAIIAFVRLETKMSSHSKTDESNFGAVEKRFGSVDEMLTEMRGDIKQLLIRHDTRYGK